MKRVAVFGCTGMLGYDLIQTFMSKGVLTFGVSSKTVDIRSFDSVYFYLNFLHAVSPLDYVINAAAYTAVDLCETETDLAFHINTTGAVALSEACEKLGIPLVHFSTDYVFDGSKSEPYTESDPIAPLSVYGDSKARAEQAIIKGNPKHYILRVQWLYGYNGTHFVKRIVELGKSLPELSVVSDQFGSPTWTKSLSEWVYQLLSLKPDYGIYHLTPEGYTNWFLFTQMIFKYLGITTPVKPVSTDHFPRPAKRPLNGRLATEKAKSIGLSFPSFESDLALFLIK